MTQKNPVYHAVEFAIIGKGDKQPEFGLVCAYPAQMITGSNGEQWPESEHIDLGFVRAQARALGEYNTLNAGDVKAVVRVSTRADGKLFNDTRGRKPDADMHFSAMQDYATEEEATSWRSAPYLFTNGAKW